MSEAHPPTDALTHLINGLVPLVPSEEARTAIRRIFGTVGPGQNARHMDHWTRGKLMQGCGAEIPYKHEEEHATGLYDQEIRPVLIGALLTWAAEHGASIDTRSVPKATNELVLIDRGYRVERDKANARIELFRPDFTLAQAWWYGNTPSPGIERNPALSEIRAEIDRDLEERSA